jgi:hypothetical protein
VVVANKSVVDSLAVDTVVFRNSQREKLQMQKPVVAWEVSLLATVLLYYTVLSSLSCLFSISNVQMPKKRNNIATILVIIKPPC